MDVSDDSFHDFFPTKLIKLNASHFKPTGFKFNKPTCTHCKNCIYEEIDAKDCEA
ncbi:hypothetical protein QE152_g41599, partial [Popillia japonica]